MNNDFQTTLMADKDKVSFDENALLDRIINLKLFVEDGNGVQADTFVIRSDFEAYYPKLMDSVASNDLKSFINQNKCFIRKCQNKPSIKVQYKRVSLTSSIEVDIFVNNFYMIDKSGNIITGFNNETYKLARVDFALGYFNQFQSLFITGKPQSVLELQTVGFADTFSLAGNNPNIGHGITVMTMSNVEYVQMDSLPPDLSLHIHGYVGNTLAPQTGASLSEGLPNNFELIMDSQAVIPAQLKAGMTTYLDRVYYETITRQWVKKGTPSKLESTEVAVGKDVVTGKMSDIEAEKYGIKVYLSKGAKEYSAQVEKERFKKGADGKLIEPKLLIPKASTAENKMNAIENYLGLKDFSHILIDSFGDYIVYKKEELQDINKMLQETKFNTVYKSTALALSWKNCIPAVYNITNDALCTIVCPFFSFINPFEKLYFKSRYALGGLVSYYANFTQANRDEFYALWQNVSFATVDDINECTIVCTGQKKGIGNGN